MTLLAWRSRLTWSLILFVRTTVAEHCSLLRFDLYCVSIPSEMEEYSKIRHLHIKDDNYCNKRGKWNEIVVFYQERHPFLQISTPNCEEQTRDTPTATTKATTTTTTTTAISCAYYGSIRTVYCTDIPKVIPNGRIVKFIVKDEYYCLNQISWENLFIKLRKQSPFIQIKHEICEKVSYYCLITYIN